MRLKKEQINKYKQVILNGINPENYGAFQCENDREKIQFVLECFNAEYYKWQSHRNIKSVFTEYLQGLPSCVNIPFMNWEILEMASEISKINFKTEKQEWKIIDNYFNFMTDIFFKLVKDYKIKL